MIKSRDIEDIVYLIRESDYHNWWGKQYFIDLIKVPYSLNQYVIVRKNNKPVCFATWAFPNEEQIIDYLTDLKFSTEGFDSNGKTPWIIDFISVGGIRNTTTGFRVVKNVLSSKGYKQFVWFRTQTQKLGFHKWG
tara:strand:+ start:867 stop:1271 length:405 start_codon:yes stop_codon:yes gene_type:complete